MTDTNMQSGSAEELVAEVDSGARNLTGSFKNLIPTICLIWALYQLYIASPLPFMLTSATGIDAFIFVGNLSISRKIHLIFALVLAILAFPLLKSSPRTKIPLYDWVLLAVGMSAILYMIFLDSNIANRAGDFTHTNIPYDMTSAVIGMAVLTLCVYRSLGLPLVIVAAVLMSYVFIGGGNWGGASFVKGMCAFLDAGRRRVR